jgi:hypothetical protein
MAEERLLSVDEFLLTLIVKVMHESPDLTAAAIARLVSNRTARRVDRRHVDSILGRVEGDIVSVTGVPPCRVVRRRRRGLFRRAAQWRLVEAPASPPDSHEAPVPARPYKPTISGAAAATLSFRKDEPPTDAVGKSA